MKKGAVWVPAAAFGIFVPKLLRAGPPWAGNARSPYRSRIHPPAAGGGASCPPDGSPDVVNTSVNATQNLQGGLNHFGGQKNWQDASDRTICKVGFVLTKAAGSIVGKTYKCRIYTMNGTSLDTLVGTSDGVAGSDAWSSTMVYFSFSTKPTLTGGTNYGIVQSLDPGQADASNFLQMNASTTAATVAGVGSFWEDDGAAPWPERAPFAGDCGIEIYYFD